MDRCRRVARLWNWLPSFRAIAETENLSAASAYLHVTPPALSRTLRLLEEDLEVQLFDRIGRNLVLNDEGRALLVEVRESMRRVHSCIERIGADGPKEVRISAPGSYHRLFVRPALATVNATRSAPVVPQLYRLAESTVPTSLRKGLCDLALTHEAVKCKDIEFITLPALRFSVYRAPSAPQNHRFAVLIDPGTRRSLDGWPEDEPRDIVVKTEHVEDLCDAMHTDGLLAFLPDIVAHAHQLERVHDTLQRDVPLYLMRRPPLPDNGVIDDVADALLNQVRQRLAPTPPIARTPQLAVVGS